MDEPISDETIEYIDWRNSISNLLELLENAVFTSRPPGLTVDEAELLIDFIKERR